MKVGLGDVYPVPVWSLNALKRLKWKKNCYSFIRILDFVHITLLIQKKLLYHKNLKTRKSSNKTRTYMSLAIQVDGGRES